MNASRPSSLSAIALGFMESLDGPSDSWLDFISSTPHPELCLAWILFTLCQSTLGPDALLVVFTNPQRFVLVFVAHILSPKSSSTLPVGITPKLKNCSSTQPMKLC
jgi:hypothetical protein